MLLVLLILLLIELQLLRVRMACEIDLRQAGLLQPRSRCPRVASCASLQTGKVL
jgi:hypothetical protein